MYKFISLSSLLLSALLTSCSEGEQVAGQNGGSNSSSSSTVIPSETVLLSSPQNSENFFSNRDYSSDIDADSPVTIHFDGNTILCEGEGVKIAGSIVTITQEGSYVLTGNLEEGQVLVETIDISHKVQLVLDNVSMHCSTGPCIDVVSADKVFLTLPEGTENELSANISTNNSSDAGIFSKKDLSINGSGSLHLEVSNGDGIVSKDELTITGGSFHIESEGHGLDANDGIAIAEGSFHIVSGKDGIHAEHNSNPDKGNVYILGGDFVIESGQDGIQAGGYLEIHDGTFHITSNGGWENAPVTVASSNNGRGGSTVTTSNEDDLPSCKGIKTLGAMLLFGGDFVLDCYEDSLHSDSTLEIHGGTYRLSTADDAIHADWEVILAGGDIDIVTSFEGIEGQRVHISGGDIAMYCGDDGINASGNSDPNSSEISLVITGGNITMDTNSEGDGVDSNGNILITGGNILVSSTTSNRDTQLDSDGKSVIQGGSFVGTGSNSGTLQNFDSSSTQGSIVVLMNSTQTGQVTLTDSQGTVLVDVNPLKEYYSVTISIPELTVGETYELTAGSHQETIKLDSLQHSVNMSSNSGKRR